MRNIQILFTGLILFATMECCQRTTSGKDVENDLGATLLQQEDVESKLDTTLLQQEDSALISSYDFENERKIAMQYIKDNEHNEYSEVSHIFDTILQEFPDLVAAIDPYFVLSKSGYDAFKDGFDTLENIRTNICKYYDIHNMGDRNLDKYSKLDSVVNYAIRIIYKYYEPYFGASAPTSIAYNEISMLKELKHYNLFQSMYKKHDKETKKLLWKEFEAWMKLEKALMTIGGECVSLVYGNATCNIHLRAEKNLKIKDAHISLYNRDNGERGGNGVSQILSKKLLIDVIKDYVKCYRKEDIDTNYYNWKYYDECSISIEKNLPKLEKLIDRWLIARNSYTESIGTDGERPWYILSTSSVLIDCAVAISSIGFSGVSMDEQYGLCRKYNACTEDVMYILES